MSVDANDRPASALVEAGLAGAARIGAERVRDAAVFPVRNPATGATLAEVADLGGEAAVRAIDAASAALPAWRATPPFERAAVLKRWHALLMAEQDGLAWLLTCEQGKPLAEAAGEVAYAAAYVEWFAEEARRLDGEVLAATATGRRTTVLREPVGVVAAITPWNFPAAMVTRKLAPALAAGCTVVLKPSELTPLTALALAEAASRAGVPPGVLNVVTGCDAAAIGAALTGDARVRKLTFTGSTAVGRRLAAQAAGTLQRLSLELGGNAPFIVFDDADLEAAVDGAMASKFRNAGQTCICADRFYVHAAVHDAFVARLAERAAALRLGDGLRERTDLGPLITPQAAARVRRRVDDAIQAGARLVTGGSAPPGDAFVVPAVLSGVSAGMALMDEETFGPVAAVARFETEEEALSLANASPAGLAAYVFGAGTPRLDRVAQALEVGMVGVNTGLISSETVPFGGVKQSGYGREGSRHGLYEYTNLKTISATT